MKPDFIIDDPSKKQKMIDKERLTEREYWQKLTDSSTSEPGTVPTPSFGRRFVSWFFGRIPRRYASYLFFDIECPKFFSRGNLKVIEIGSAPGEILLTFHQKFGYTPYGVEYNAAGAELNRRLFERFGISGGNVILADFFDQKFQEKYREHFDVVLSCGFIEHFGNPGNVIAKHLNLLKPGGTILITVPNFRWLNYLLLRFFSPQAIKAHNLQVMKKKNLSAYFKDTPVEILSCKYFGTLNLGLIYGKNKKRFKLLLVKVAMKCQSLIDIMLYLVFRKGGIESSLFSPHLMIVCRKKK